VKTALLSLLFPKRGSIFTLAMKHFSQFNLTPYRVTFSGLSCLILMLVSLLCFPVTASWGSHLPLEVSQKVNPSVVSIVRQDLSRRTKIEAKQFQLVSAKQQTWPDGCLGLSKPDEFCTQALIKGWRIVLSYRDRSWTYRTDEQGRVIRLETQF
jgi:hypothetical protein